MSEGTKISWCDDTCNFYSGCTEVGPGYVNCYARELAKRFSTFGGWGKGAPRRLHESAFKLAHKLNRKPWICDGCGKAWPPRAVTWKNSPPIFAFVSGRKDSEISRLTLGSKNQTTN